MYDYLEKKLRSFIHNEKSNNVENCGARNCCMPIKDTKLPYKVFLNIVFTKYQGFEATYTDLGTHGYVLALPEYWIDVDENSVIWYVASFVDKWLSKNFGYNTDDDSDSDKEHHCCPDHHHHHPPHPCPPGPPPGPHVRPGPPPPPGVRPVTPPPPMEVISTGGIEQYGYPVPPGE